MLMIQKFIKENNDWRDKLSSAPFNLKIKEEDGFVLFKYDQISSDFEEKICKEARGLILDSQDNFKVVRFAFEKFFNLGEVYADKIDWNTCVASEKLDGSLMTIWYARGEWHLSTNNTINAYNAELSCAGPYKNFGELFSAAAVNSGLDLEKIPTNLMLTFELCSEFNRVVIAYQAPKLYHILTRDNQTLKEIEFDCGVQKPKSYFFNNEEDYKALVSKMDETHEGIVVKDAANRRVKIKTPLYFELHRMAGNGKMTLDRAIELIKTNDYQELLVYFPQYENYFLIVKNRINYCNRLAKTIPHIVDVWKSHSNFNSEREARKEFALKISSIPLKHLYFKAYNGDLESYLNSLTTNQWLKVFASEFKDLV